MTLRLERADFSDPDLAAFLQAHLDDLAPTAPLESRHALDLEALQKPSVRMWVARDDGTLVGTCAVAELEPGHEELKSMRTHPSYRGRGIARALLDHVIADARARSVGRVSLETGSMDFFAAARALYATAGFDRSTPFGSYELDPNSVYMTRAL